MARIVIVPGLAVRGYAKPAAAALLRDGHDVSLLAAPAWRRTRTDLGRYGRLLARELDSRRENVDLLVGLSVGTQAAAAAAAATERIRRLLLLSPTVDPVHRTVTGLVARWVKGDSDGRNSQPAMSSSIPDWAQAGVPRIGAALLSAVRTPLEQILVSVTADITVVHAEHDLLGTERWARSLAVDGAHFRSMPDAPHSWPVGDPPRFRSLITEVLA